MCLFKLVFLLSVDLVNGRVVSLCSSCTLKDYIKAGPNRFRQILVLLRFRYLTRRLIQTTLHTYNFP